MRTKVAVFFGGRSTEHEISVISANQAINAIDDSRYEVIPVYISKQGKWYVGKHLTDLKRYRNIPDLLKDSEEVFMKGVYGDYNLYYNKPKGLFGKNSIYTNIDVAIPVLHGANGEDGSFQGIMQSIGIPFAGCDVLSSANGMDKIYMKMILQASHLPVIPYVWFTDKHWIHDSASVVGIIEEKLGYPVIVKPSNLGSSVGIGHARDRKELEKRIMEGIKYSTRIIVEHMIENLHEINCSVLGDADKYETSVLEEPIKSGEILSYEDKYLGGTKGAKGMQASQKRIPAELSLKLTEEIRRCAGETFRALSCCGVSRVDLIIDEDDKKFYVNEINTIPGSLSFYLWEASGVSFTQLMDRIIELAIKRNSQLESKIVSYDQNIFNMGVAGGTKNCIKGTGIK